MKEASIFLLDFIKDAPKLKLEFKKVPLAYKPADITPAKEALPSPNNSALK